MDAEKHRVLSPTRVGEVADLKPQTSGALVITPETKVLCINRGREPVFDTWDSRHYTIPVGYFSIELGAARHFKDRAVVPGSRNPETRYQASFLAIIGVAMPTVDGLKIVHPIDAPHEWDPFTDEECLEFGMAIEAIDRESMVDPIEDDVVLAPTRGQRNEDAKQAAKSRLKGGKGGTGGRLAKISGTAVDQGMLKGGSTAPNEAVRQIQQDMQAVSSHTED